MSGDRNILGPTVAIKDDVKYLSLTIGGSGGATGNYGVKYVKRGNLVTMTIPNGTVNVTGVGTIVLSGVPVNIRPANANFAFGRLINSGVNIDGGILVTTGGDIQLWVSAAVANFSIGPGGLFDAATMSWFTV